MASSACGGGGEDEAVGEGRATPPPQKVKCPSCDKDTRLFCEHCRNIVRVPQVNVGKVKNLWTVGDTPVNFSHGRDKGSDLGILKRFRQRGVHQQAGEYDRNTHPFHLQLDDEDTSYVVEPPWSAMRVSWDEVSDDVLMLREDWSGVSDEQPSAEPTTDKKTEILVTKIINERSFTFFESILEEIQKEGLPAKVTRTLYKQWRLRLLGLTKGLEVLMEVEAGRVADILQNESQIQQLLLELVSEAERNNVTWDPAHSIPVQREDDTEMAARLQVDVNSTETVNGALRYACQYGNYLTCKKLLAYQNADVTVLDRCGKTLFHIACQYGQSGILDLLLKAGTQVNQPDGDGLGPLHLACGRGSADPDIEEGKRHSTVQWLLQNGVDVHLKNPSGKTAEDLAKMGSYQSIVQLLQNHNG